MDKESKRFLSYLRDLYEGGKQEMDNKSLSFIVVKAYINHIPRKQLIQKTDDDWDDEIYKLSHMFLLMLYEYSKEMDYISRDMAFEDFVEL
jgi:hypothetical protein